MRCLLRSVPAAIPGIAFHSGGLDIHMTINSDDFRVRAGEKCKLRDWPTTMHSRLFLPDLADLRHQHADVDGLGEMSGVTCIETVANVRILAITAQCDSWQV